ncbi:Methyltransferase domain-containing protein [Clostridium collagenovorans DSM 3089]|uniref:site-specific DNA-methyltransferase (adenine-specific) n=1 Tax=Clostridium collagenovorans DSM 3089 TaxID=1121306 RepID=A0A1M5U1V3_9CLOT|nr:BREX-1 system adenine-specific DNA-methyltransferase PglX [Clostridium collagenovorans]SHH57065.1 Methyltransferase domain-containing protein [Clostridium collagenovorans DSM 3089]
MDKNQIKIFSTWARVNLIESITKRAIELGIEENKVHDIEILKNGFKVIGREKIFKSKLKHREKLIDDINKLGFNKVIEEVACTWFNRFIALRYMEVNNYLPSGIRILSSERKGQKEPDVLTKITEIIEKLELNEAYINQLLEKGKNEDINELYKYILVNQCNDLGKIIPNIFEEIEDYTELLLPDNLLQENFIIRHLTNDIGENNFQEGIEVVGWLYQYYISDKKDQVFEGLKKNIKITKDNIPAATQLFTPKWIVKYMVQNSLGALWLESHESNHLKDSWKYYLEQGETKDKLRENNMIDPKNITILDPCMGSGHMLVYAFEVLYDIYKSYGYFEEEIPILILKNNIFGLDIDSRVSSLCSFALIMKARTYDKSLFFKMKKEQISLNICDIVESSEISEEAISYFSKGNNELEGNLKYLINIFEDAKDYGSLIKVPRMNFEAFKNRIEEVKEDYSLCFHDYKEIVLKNIVPLIKQAEIMSSKYSVCLTNPPYMGIRGMNTKLSTYLSENYELSKHDLFSVYMEVCNEFSEANGYSAIINQQSWMFLSSFAEFRKNLLNELCFKNIIHLGPRAFEENVGTIVQNVAYIAKKRVDKDFKTIIINLTQGNSKEKEATLKSALKGENTECKYKINLEILCAIPGNPFAYWISENILELFKNNIYLGQLAKPRQGMATSDNKRFLRYWFEVENNKIKFDAKDAKEAKSSCKKWFPYNKGGTFKKWYGNNDFVINWECNGREVKEYAAKLYKSYSRTIKNEDLYFKKGLTYTFISEAMGVRYSPSGFIFDVAGSSIFFDSEEKIYVILALLCSKVAKLFLDIMNPTYNIQVGDLKNIPIKKDIFEEENLRIINYLVLENIELTKREWDNFETSWDFKVHPLIRLKDKLSYENSIEISKVFKLWEEESLDIFNRVKRNEEELNKIFISIYGLQEEGKYVVKDKDITIRKAEVERDIKSLISYGIGCILGRYSLKEEGIVYAGGERSIEDGKILPILNYEYFEEDILQEFIAFIKKVYGEDTLEENLDFIAEALGRKGGETSRQSIRRYFLKDFYKDHVRIYHKRPIYWLLDSGKNEGFKALIYAHEYNETIVGKIKRDYLQVLQKKYENAISRFKLIIKSKDYTMKEKSYAKEKIEKIIKQREECIEYEKVLSYIASKEIIIDMDNGIKANYDIFQNIKLIDLKGQEVKKDLLAKI